MNNILGKDQGPFTISHLTGMPAICGERVCNNDRFIGILETVYGFISKEPNKMVRTAQYERALAEYDNGNRFYSASFIRDSFGVADHLLGARDNLLMSSALEFTLETLIKCRSRLQTIARVDTIAKERGMEPGFPERLRQIINEVKKNYIPNPIISITLTDDPNIS